MRRILLIALAPLLLLASCAKEVPPPPANPIPALTADQKTMLEECTDFRRTFDEAPLYALLGAAVKWPRDAWGGAAPIGIVEQVNPLSKERTKKLEVELEPARHRGEAMLIDGLLIATQEGVPNNAGGMLSRQDPQQWGGSLTCWVIRLGGRSERDPQAMVYFPSDGRPLPQVRPGNRVRVAARFYKVFTAEVYVREPKNHGQLVAAGREEPFCAFVGGTAEVLATPLGEVSAMGKMFVLLVLIALGFGGVWFIKSYTRDMGRGRGLKSPAQRWEERLEREREDGVEDDYEEDLPEDPAEALKKLGGGKE